MSFRARVALPVVNVRCCPLANARAPGMGARTVPSWCSTTSVLRPVQFVVHVCRHQACTCNPLRKHLQIEGRILPLWIDHLPYGSGSLWQVSLPWHAQVNFYEGRVAIRVTRHQASCLGHWKSIGGKGRMMRYVASTGIGLMHDCTVYN